MTPGETAYVAYSETHILVLPSWVDLDPLLQRRWERVASMVIRSYENGFIAYYEVEDD